MKNVLLCCMGFALLQGLNAQNTSVLRSTLSVSGASLEVWSSGNTYVLQESIGQLGITGTFETSQAVVRQGFIQPVAMSKLHSPEKSVPLIYDFYPNPVDSKLTVLFQTPVSSKLSISIHNLLGVTLISKTFKPGQRFEIDTVDLPSGSYLLEVTTGNSKSLKKIIRR